MTNTDTLADVVGRYARSRAGKSPFTTAIEGLTILRAERPGRPSHRLFKPALCVVVQGAKWTTFGNKRFDYRAGQALVVSLEMPSHGRVVAAAPEEPYLSIVIEFDLAAIREVSESLGELARPTGEVGGGVFVTDFDGPMADCVSRMVGLLDTPRAIPVVYPSLMRELCYWLLAGPRGGDIARIVLANGHDQRVLAAIHTLRARFAEPVRIEELARIAQMSPFGVPPPIQGADFHDAAAIPEAAALAQSAQSPDCRRGDGRDGRLPDRLRESFAVQPRIRSHVRRAAPARRGAVARSVPAGVRRRRRPGRGRSPRMRPSITWITIT